jgi:hypothetical protein
MNFAVTLHRWKSRGKIAILKSPGKISILKQIALHSHHSSRLSLCRHARKAAIVHYERNNRNWVFHTVTKCTTFSLQTWEKGHHSTLENTHRSWHSHARPYWATKYPTDTTTNDKRWKIDPSFASAKPSNQSPCLVQRTNFTPSI